MARRTFHDQWYRIAGLRVGLRPGTLVQHQRYRGEPWVVLHDPVHAGYFRARPDTYAHIAALGRDRTLGEIWEARTRSAPRDAPGQEDFFLLIRDLYKANLLTVEGSVSETRILDRAVDKTRKPFVAKVSELLFFRLPLWDPQAFLTRHAGAIRAIYAAPAVMLVLCLVALAGVTFALNADRALTQSASILQMSNLIPLYLAIFATHVLHEMSHAALTYRYGGPVRTMGVMLLMFTPLPYADLSSAWTFRNKWRRAAVGAAGMYADTVSCAVATLIWAYSPPGMINEIALNVMFVTAVYTLFFNSNPLMRFDGYYILSDLVEIPNLHQAAKTQFNACFRHWVLRDPLPPEAQVSARRQAFLLGFFVTSNLYRIMIMAGIVIFIADQYFGLGLVVAAALVFNAFVLPLGKLMKPLTNPHFRRRHSRPLGWMALMGGALVLGLCLVPVPDTRRLSGVVAPERSARVHAATAGILRDSAVTTGDPVRAGQIIARLDNPELALQLQNLEARKRGAELRAIRSRTRRSADLAAIEEEIARLDSSLATLRREAETLVIRAGHSGIWRDAGLIGHHGAWLSQGALLGEVIAPGGHVFRAVLRQEAAEGVAGLAPQSAQLWLEGARGTDLAVTRLQLVPYSRRDLPSDALGSSGGGDVAVRVDTPQNPSGGGAQTVERFFLLTAHFAPPEAALGLGALSGRSGWLRLSLPPRPLALQGWTAVRQFFQKRYKL